MTSTSELGPGTTAWPRPPPSCSEGRWRIVGERARACAGRACAGRAGVEAALGMLAEELRTAMALAGVRDVEEAKDRRLVATPADRWGEFGGRGARGDERVSALRRWKSPGTRGKAPRAKM